VAGGDPEGEGGGRPGGIAWFSIFASGVVVGLILGLGLTPSGLVGAARQIGAVSALWSAPADQPMAPTVVKPAASGGEGVTDGPPLPGPLVAPPHDRMASRPVPPSSGDTAAPPSTPVAAPTFAPIPAGDHPLTIGVFGDSLADGLWAGLYRQMRDGDHVDVVKFSQVATGLTRYDYVDVQQKTEGQLAKKHVDVAVILFGTNDQQGIIQDGKVFAFGTPGWRDIYVRRIDTLVATLRRQGATVYWVGLPKMRADGFDKRAQILNAIYQERMGALGVRFIPTDGATEDNHGAYAAYLPSGPSNKMTLMRANDGMHMSMPGYLRIATPVAASIRADLSLHAGGAVSAAAGLGR
jgi:hypothetical protein